MVTNQELIRRLQVAMSLLLEIAQQLDRRQAKVPVSTEQPFAKASSAKNDPFEFYANCCVIKQNAEITASELFCAYIDWCHINGSLSRGRRPFLDAIAQLGAEDGVIGVMRGKSYTFKNIGLKTK